MLGDFLDRVLGTEFDPEDKWLVWGRHIDEQVEWYEDRNFSDETIRKYLEKCAEWRGAWLDPDDLTDYEEKYTEIIQKHFIKYGVVDPIFQNW